MYDRALRLLALAANKAMERKVGVANRRKDLRGKAYAIPTGEEDPPCECSCGSAVSPLAYLADLLDYAVRHVREDDNPVTMIRLGQRFHQPFDQLPADCSGSQTLLRQVRLCVEVLRRKAAADSISIQNILAEHALRSYETLLAELGVSYSELRRARAASPEHRTALAGRLGIAEPQLDRFILFPPISELDLETLFGFTATESGRAIPGSSTLRDLRLSALEAQWQAADDLETAPLIDPDLIDRSWFTSDPAAVNAAEARFEERAALLTAPRSAISGHWQVMFKPWHGVHDAIFRDHSEFMSSYKLLARLPLTGQQTWFGLARARQVKPSPHGRSLVCDDGTDMTAEPKKWAW